MKTKEISTYSCTFSPLQLPDVRQREFSITPSTNIGERNSAKTQSAVVFILLPQASVHEKFIYIYIYIVTVDDPKDYNTVKGFRVWLIYFRIFQVVIGYCQRTLLLTFYEGIFKMSRSEMIFRLFLDQSEFHSREGLRNILGSFTRL